MEQKIILREAWLTSAYAWGIFMKFIQKKLSPWIFHRLWIRTSISNYSCILLIPAGWFMETDILIFFIVKIPTLTLTLTATQHNGWVRHENDCANHPTPPPTQTFEPLLDQLESWNLAQMITRQKDNLICLHNQRFFTTRTRVSMHRSSWKIIWWSINVLLTYVINFVKIRTFVEDIFYFL